MKKLVVCLAVLALAVLFTSSAVADNGLVSSAQLQAMGLSGMQVMSDADAMSVRGKMMPQPMPQPRPGDKPWTLAAGGSIAGIEGEGFIVGSAQIFVSEGQYFAGGASQASASKTISDNTTIAGPGGVVFSVTKTTSIDLATAGAVSSYAF